MRERAAPQQLKHSVCTVLAGEIKVTKETMLRIFSSRILTAVLTIAALAVVQTAWAEDVTPEEALWQAQNFMQQREASGSRPRKAQGTLQLTPTQQVSGLYIFNVADDGGFVIVSNDDRTVPVLGFSDTGSIDPDNMPENMKAWLQGYADEIAWLAARNDQTTNSPNAQSKARRPVGTHSTDAIAPMIQTTWYQITPYNNLCPLDGDERCKTGCAATALAQVMNYYQWPTDETTAIPGYYCYTLDTELEGLPPTTFDWENMKNSYKDSYTDDEATAVATLLQYCGWSLQMQYSAKGSASNAIFVADALINYFGYSKVVKDKVESTVQYVTRNFYSYANWTDLIYHELSEGRPVIYAGQSDVDGHCFICDGYKSEGGIDLFHINWGWAGKYDGYFVLSVLNFDEPGIDGSVTGKAFVIGQEAIIGIQKPSSTGTVLDVTPNVIDLTFNSISLSSSAITLGESVDVAISVTNNSEDEYDGDFALVVNYGLELARMFLIPPKTTRDCVISFKPASVGNYTIGAAYPCIGYYEGELYLEGGLLTVVDTDISLLDDDRSALEKNADLITTSNGLFVSATLSGRTFWKDGNWDTLCLPFDVNDRDADIDDEHPAETGGYDGITFTGTPLAGAEVRTLTSASLSEDVLTLYFSNPVTTIEAGKPYIIKWDGGDNIVNPTFSGVTISSATANVGDANIDFIGCTSPVSFIENDRSILFLGGDNKLYYPSTAMTIGAFRAYFKLSEELKVKSEESLVREFMLNFGDEATSLNEELRIKNEELAGAWYTIDGRKFGGKPTQKGIYINNGRKVIVK